MEYNINKKTYKKTDKKIVKKIVKKIDKKIVKKIDKKNRIIGGINIKPNVKEMIQNYMLDIFNNINNYTCNLIFNILKAINYHKSCKIFFETLNQKGIIKLGVINFVKKITDDAEKNGIIEILKYNSNDIKSLAKSVNGNKYFMNELKLGINKSLLGCKSICVVNGREIIYDKKYKSMFLNANLESIKGGFKQYKIKGGLDKYDINNLWDLIIIPIVELFEEQVNFIEILTDILSYENFNRLFLEIKPNVVKYVMNKFLPLLETHKELFNLIQILFVKDKNNPNKFQNFELLDKILVSDKNIISKSLNSIDFEKIDKMEEINIKEHIKKNINKFNVCVSSLVLFPTLLWNTTTILTLKKNLKLIKNEYCRINPEKAMCTNR